MNYRMSPNIAVPTGVADAAEAFYSEVLGCPVRTRSGDTVDIAADPPSIFITADEEIVGRVLALFVEGLEVAREELVATVVKWCAGGGRTGTATSRICSARCSTCGKRFRSSSLWRGVSLLDG